MYLTDHEEYFHVTNGNALGKLSVSRDSFRFPQNFFPFYAVSSHTSITAIQIFLLVVPQATHREGSTGSRDVQFMERSNLVIATD